MKNIIKSGKAAQPLTPTPSNGGETAVKVGTVVVAVYIVWKLIGVAATISTGGLAAPVLAL